MSQSVETIVPPTTADAAAAREVQTRVPAVPARFPWVATWVVLGSLGALISTALVLEAGGMRGFYLPVVAGLVCLLAGLFDGTTGRIPNPLTYTAILLGLLLNGVTPLLEWAHAHAGVVWLGATGPESSLLGFGVCAGLGIIGCLLAGVHGGDLKLLAGVGAMLGLMETANVLLVALTVALVYALVNLAVFGRLNKVVRVGAMRVLEMMYLRRFEVPEVEEGKASHIPMAVPLGVGLVVAQVWEWKSGGTIL